MSGSVYSSGTFMTFFVVVVPRGKGPEKYQILSILYLPIFLMGPVRN